MNYKEKKEQINKQAVRNLAKIEELEKKLDGAADRFEELRMNKVENGLGIELNQREVAELARIKHVVYNKFKQKGNKPTLRHYIGMYVAFNKPFEWLLFGELPKERVVHTEDLNREIIKVSLAIQKNYQEQLEQCWDYIEKLKKEISRLKGDED